MTIPNDKNIPLQSHGFSLLEVLVALLVLSVGLLGLAALQTVGLKFNTQSYQRTQAVLQAYDMIDRIRANPVAKANGDYDTVTPPGYIPPSFTDCTVSPGCSPTQLAEYDVAMWNAANASFIAEGKGEISTNGTVRKITIRWKENDLPKTFIVEADL